MSGVNGSNTRGGERGMIGTWTKSAVVVFTDAGQVLVYDRISRAGECGWNYHRLRSDR